MSFDPGCNAFVPSLSSSYIAESVHKSNGRKYISNEFTQVKVIITSLIRKKVLLPQELEADKLYYYFIWSC